ncbi:LacI family DNA-binding transcriptional regulator [Terracoccus luteus]|uniref:DNA-binding LacI/PurR family transcriptional regulator n=1 Tax=Terracoccus luteus TaxID=53356 RepID=A0A839PRQ9_9MICO|nr:LacI family DNA-binding transcriptional regulator [Terracoccus luteus]MBB2986870.1 DNA-binding LacI/PurR family transcriptional regulator [Terracoccus luteus]MCP2172521.1 DNA-binding LacI/PurR family transcriptional regulator [Terracoccus luteus]
MSDLATRAPVMQDVARLAGVSHQTVSRVINNASSIRPATRDRVLEAIEQLGYRPNTAARSLVRGRSGTIGIISTESTLFGPTSVHRTVDKAARDSGFSASSVTLASVTRGDFDAAVESLMQHAVEGIVVIAGHDDALEVARSRSAALPFVIVEGDLTRARRSVGVDNVAGARMATQHLLGLGHTEIAHVTGPLDWAESRARSDGWRQAMVDAGLRPLEPITGDWSSASGYAAGRRLAENPDVTAVFTANDQMAIGVLLALHEAGREVPVDVSVVGFDDVPEAAYVIPPLTTVRQDFPAIGRAAIGMLTAAIAGEKMQKPSLIDPELVVRRSTASPRPDR